MRNAARPLTAEEKRKGKVIAEAAPAEFFARHGIDTDFKTVGDLTEAVEVLGCYLHDLPPIVAEQVYRKLSWQNSEG